jgi:UDP-N-acetyl-D-galactosamine dehydrogenase
VDPYYLTHKAEKLGYIPQVILAGRRINDNMGRYVARSTIKQMLVRGIDVARSRIGVLGITFKENCPDIRNSKVLDIVKELRSYGVEVVICDPHADPHDVREEYGIELGKIDADHQVDTLIAAVSHSEYKTLPAARLRAMVRGDKPVFADVKSIFNRTELEALGFAVWRL